MDNLKKEIKALLDILKTNKGVAAQTLSASLEACLANIAKFELQNGAKESLTDAQIMRAVIAPYIKQVGSKTILNGVEYAGDIPPAVLWSFYYKLTQSAPAPQVVPVAEVAVEKKPLPAALVAPLKSDKVEAARKEAEKNQKLSEVTEADMAEVLELLNKSRKQTGFLANKLVRAKSAALVAIAINEGLVDEMEINLAGDGTSVDLPFIEVVRRIWAHFKGGANE